MCVCICCCCCSWIFWFVRSCVSVVWLSALSEFLHVLASCFSPFFAFFFSTVFAIIWLFLSFLYLSLFLFLTGCLTIWLPLFSVSLFFFFVFFSLTPLSIFLGRLHSGQYRRERDDVRPSLSRRSPSQSEAPLFSRERPHRTETNDQKESGNDSDTHEKPTAPSANYHPLIIIFFFFSFFFVFYFFYCLGLSLYLFRRENGRDGRRAQSRGDSVPRSPPFDVDLRQPGPPKPRRGRRYRPRRLRPVSPGCAVHPGEWRDVEGRRTRTGPQDIHGSWVFFCCFSFPFSSFLSFHSCFIFLPFVVFVYLYPFFLSSLPTSFLRDISLFSVLSLAFYFFFVVDILRGCFESTFGFDCIVLLCAFLCFFLLSLFLYDKNWANRPLSLYFIFFFFSFFLYSYSNSAMKRKRIDCRETFVSRSNEKYALFSPFFSLLFEESSSTTKKGEKRGGGKKEERAERAEGK